VWPINALHKFNPRLSIQWHGAHQPCGLNARNRPQIFEDGIIEGDAALIRGICLRGEFIQAEAQLNAIQTQIVQEMPANQGDHSPGSLLASVQPLQEAMVEDSKMGLWLLMSAVFGLMLIACLTLGRVRAPTGVWRKRHGCGRGGHEAGLRGAYLVGSGLRLRHYYSAPALTQVSRGPVNGCATEEMGAGEGKGRLNDDVGTVSFCRN
jgi:hypothetical protein